MFDSVIKRIEINGKSYPYKCDLLVLEKLQESTGDLTLIDDRLRGFEPYVDDDGVADTTRGKFVMPDIRTVCEVMSLMIEEGIEITGEDMEGVSPLDLKRQEDHSLLALSSLVFDEFKECVAGKKTEN